MSDLSLAGFAYAGLGASLQEIVHWYSLRGRLPAYDFGEELRSVLYWVITLLMLAGASAGTVVWYLDTSPSPPARDYLLMGAAFPTLFKKLVQAFLAQQKPQQGGTLGSMPASIVARNYFL